ncbi:hypothetical protein SOVF_041250 [Spinacia oleracea]|uniref:Membrane lipoprotein n=1 Tax=Spinacia oleracea TaxID=3562 RepID=A0A9R0JKS3_SPIOL|nr:uncharacterized protein LOC110778136 [Spinacia oleracea]KNA21653.1 hypothetical protein SOVF_041250 [Spinacia oleracea]
MAKSKLRSSFSFPNLLLSCLNLTLFLLSFASLAPIFLLKTPPTSLGCALLVPGLVSLLSSFLGFYSRLTELCFTAHISFILASLASQVFSFLVLFTREKASLSMLKSPRDPREAKVLVMLECGILMVMFVLQVVVLVLSCGVHKCWVRKYEGLEEEREKTSRKRNRKIAGIDEGKPKELDEKVKSKNDFEGYVR